MLSVWVSHRGICSCLVPVQAIKVRSSRDSSKSFKCIKRNVYDLKVFHSLPVWGRAPHIPWLSHEMNGSCYCSLCISAGSISWRRWVDGDGGRQGRGGGVRHQWACWSEKTAGWLVMSRFTAQTSGEWSFSWVPIKAGRHSAGLQSTSGTHTWPPPPPPLLLSPGQPWWFGRLRSCRFLFYPFIQVRARPKPYLFIHSFI